jgi:hypothetical protein
MAGDVVLLAICGSRQTGAFHRGTMNADTGAAPRMRFSEVPGDIPPYNEDLRTPGEAASGIGMLKSDVLKSDVTTHGTGRMPRPPAAIKSLFSPLK